MGRSTSKIVFKALRFGLLCGLITVTSTLFLLFLLSILPIGPTDPIDFALCLILSQGEKVWDF